MLLQTTANNEQISEEKFVPALQEEPPIAVKEARQPYDVYRAFLISLLLTSVVGSYCVAYFVG